VPRQAPVVSVKIETRAAWGLSAPYLHQGAIGVPSYAFYFDEEFGSGPSVGVRAGRKKEHNQNCGPKHFHLSSPEYERVLNLTDTEIEQNTGSTLSKPKSTSQCMPMKILVRGMEICARLGALKGIEN
jgi:hypothetical protein